jgi:threonine dehydrogenase-like Zn-dependent dehydrogenase
MYKRILLPVSNPRNAAYTLKAALQLLDPDGTIVLLSVVGTSEDYPIVLRAIGKRLIS